MARIIAPCLRALLDRFIDYAGMFPPAGLSCDVAIANYKRYRKGEHAWMLRWLVVPCFKENAHWRDWSLGTEQIREARQRFVHSVGFCSFDEPVQGLRALGLL